MIDVTIENFEAEVIHASMQTPVLVDFWAPWCGPCRTLGPILEKLETAYGGRFKLVKIDSDQEQQIASMFGVRSIPTCVLMVEGRPVDGFMGALPEGQVREFLDKHLPAGETIPEEEDLQEPEPETDLQTRLEQLQKAVQEKPDDEQARFDYVKLLLEMGLEDEAKVAFAPVIALAETSQRYGALKTWMDALDLVHHLGDANARLKELDAAIASNRRDFAARLERARILLAHNQWTAAMDELLEILMRDKGWEDGLARKAYVAILELIEPPRPPVAEGQIPPEDPTVASYRRRLSSVVLS
ncbi:thioredoxin [Corticibacter populi]|uniref:Thioredoxin n=1 Tax=Corticibacter populi TaxID=1550736 RepID=A0A3M6QPT7_9BURK|nr:thioredoxin [Corticibacter populi]RMX04801.1 thioredoxin [Corticibacter populi]RZS33786.1 thioredoxin [Corticibacter populi]